MKRTYRRNELLTIMPGHSAYDQGWEDGFCRGFVSGSLSMAVLLGIIGLFLLWWIIE